MLVHKMDLEMKNSWVLRNFHAEALYWDGEDRLKRGMLEVKSCEEFSTGRTVSFCQAPPKPKPQLQLSFSLS